MIVFDDVSFRFDETTPAILDHVSLCLAEGELHVVAGRTGSGKSTFLGAMNGHVPTFTGGILTGKVSVDGLDTATHPPRDLAHIVGVVAQDPLSGFVTDTVEDELAYGMEQMGVHRAAMRVSVEETMDILGIADLRQRSLRTLSGGQQQRVAIGSVLAGGARVLVLDEPTSALDPVSSEEVLAALLRLVHDVGLTVVVAEHRLERVGAYADSMVLLDGSGAVLAGSPADVMEMSPIAPPVVELARQLGWSPLPLSVRQARRMAGSLTDSLADKSPQHYRRLTSQLGLYGGVLPAEGDLVAEGLCVSYGNHRVVDRASITFRGGQVTVVMGRNGSGKSSLLWGLTGVVPLESGTVAFAGEIIKKLSPDKVRQWLRLVPQTASDLLYLPTVNEECRMADTQAQREPGSCRNLLDAITPDIPGDANPRDLSQGQQLSLVLAIQLTPWPRVVLLDEPTRGLDYPAKHALARILAALARQGRAVGVVTHDVEFAAEVADRVVIMANAEVIQVGDVGEVLGTSALFAPQMAKVLYPQRWMTPLQVELAAGVVEVGS